MENTRKESAKTVLMNTLEQLLHIKPFQKISVNELCETALVSQSSFYANFEDKYHLLACCLESKSHGMISVGVPVPVFAMVNTPEMPGSTAHTAHNWNRTASPGSSNKTISQDHRLSRWLVLPL